MAFRLNDGTAAPHNVAGASVLALRVWGVLPWTATSPHYRLSELCQPNKTAKRHRQLHCISIKRYGAAAIPPGR